ncbi:cas scaffolding protein family member 4 isoform X2 [Genypterus blacodes]|uniref:cas scaffolding protein family member 4 isoform X2 n=1 Tax=Genypterus blacodes TaxID=154954 RepID=UPI003F769E1F
MENKLAKALYDNTAECPDELAFRKGDIVTVMDAAVADSSGWWMCSLYGRQGLAPANRLQLLQPAGTAAGAEKLKLAGTQTADSPQNIYQIPSVPRASSSAYEHMDRIYKVPSAPLAPSHSAGPSSPTANKPPGFSTANGEVYDVPRQVRRASLYAPSTMPRQMVRKASLVPVCDLEKRFTSRESLSCIGPRSYVYVVPPALPQDPNYDIPVPSATEVLSSGYSTMPNPRKQEWIYDVPVSPDKQSPPQVSFDPLPPKAACRQLWPPQRCSPTRSLYDIPKPSSLDVPSPPTMLPRCPVYDKPPTQMLSEEPPQATPPQELHLSSDPPLECRGDSGDAYKHTRAHLQRMRKVMKSSTFRARSRLGDSLLQEEEERGRGLRLSVPDSQRISTASSSSTSSCDSLALSSSSPEPLREVSLSQDEASRRLLELQEGVCRAVPRLMDFVSSHWRSKEHLGKHLEEIKQAAEGIVCSVTCFLNFSLDVKGNARRLTDSNLQTRLYKQLCIVEDSGLILQQTVSALNVAAWPLAVLSQDPGQVQTPDQLERFVMVARTVPEDVKRLVSIINANGKLLFRAPQKEPELLNITEKSEQTADMLEDDNDYVELQTKNEFEKQQKEEKTEPEPEVTPAPVEPQVDKKRDTSECVSAVQAPKTSLTEHCRLYFGALQKAISGFVCSLQQGQPPEKFISHSKLVIMVGQRLVDTLYRKAQGGDASQGLLCKSNHLCALLKQLAVATKKAALHFPDKQTLHEAQEFAKELAQRAQHFRSSLDL